MASSGMESSVAGSFPGKEVAKLAVRHAMAAGRLVRRANQSLIQQYLAEAESKKLHIGCGYIELDGWLNSDRTPRSSNVLALDAAKTFPFEDATFDRVYSEHMIEHIPYSDAKAMLAESFRTLKRGGRIRIVTPDINFLISLYQDELTTVQQKYIAWSCENFTPEASQPSPLFVFNNFVRDWGHTFIYDAETMRNLLSEVGFVDVAEGEISFSDDKEFVGLESVDRMQAGFLELESLIIEAAKP